MPQHCKDGGWSCTVAWRTESESRIQFIYIAHTSKTTTLSNICSVHSHTWDLILMKDESHQQVSISSDKCIVIQYALFPITVPPCICASHLYFVCVCVCACEHLSFFVRKRVDSSLRRSIWLLSVTGNGGGWECMCVCVVYVVQLVRIGARWMRWAILIAISIDVHDYYWSAAAYPSAII